MTRIQEMALILLGSVAVFMFAAEAGHAAESYKIDSVHSAILFRIKHFDLSYFHGRFNEVSGTFAFDENDPSKSRIEVVVPVESIDTNSKDRDDHVKGPELFNAAKFPQLTFKSTKVEPAGSSQLKVTGDLTMLGVTKSITVSLEQTGSGKDPWGGYRSGFETVFTIKRTDFGMNALLGGLSDEVRLTVSIEGVRK